MPAHSLIFSKSTKGTARLSVPIRRTNRYQQYYVLLNIHTAEGFAILSRPVMYNLAIRKCTSPPLLAPRLKIFKLKIYYPAGDRTPDLLNQRQTCYHLSQHGEFFFFFISVNIYDLLFLMTYLFIETKIQKVPLLNHSHNFHK